ncbi:hypothetical protein A3K93_06740 [Acinetobacter sp. NCu2D-2]|uniref:hypothetical protein n=1 Tax=Acinetobacter sp. NCu2D-2 TaxID=1608473 RepID=UPI0007CDA9E3|nr:hypothetical protein [Acinetobacter sp. NCu2D-2]ANF81915.1 hypothetical protein A3K93_06740 [Acinetobacter sp. NCu2D-2]
MALTHQKNKPHHNYSNVNFDAFKGTAIPSQQIKDVDFGNKNVLIIGINQMIVTHLNGIVQHASSVKVFQNRPAFIIPNSETKIANLIYHPLIRKNRRLFSQRIKSLIAMRFLDIEVQDQWLKSQLTPNLAHVKKMFLKSDKYYLALQKPNCQLITWPIIDVFSESIQTVNQENHAGDLIIFAENE